MARKAGLEELGDGDWCSLNHPDVRGADLERFAELVRQDEREQIEKIVKHLRPKIIGKANDIETHQQWCDSATTVSRFESIIAAIRARSEK
jgi:hypothetical protein